MSITTLRKYALSFACLATLSSTSEAALTISATRVVHLSDKHSSSVVVANPSKAPYAVQAWVNTQADDTSTSVPFAVSPTLFRLDPKREQLVKINALPNDLPDDRESLFYFNIQEIPQVDSGHLGHLLPPKHQPANTQMISQHLPCLNQRMVCTPPSFHPLR